MKRVLVWAVCAYLALSTARGAVVTYFPETDIGGGIIAKAQATITGGSTYLDIVVQNTSDLGPLIDGKRANPFITEIEFKYLPGFTLDEENSYASSLSGTLFAQDIGNEANNLSVRHLYYNFVSSDSPGMNRCFMTMDADNIKNDSTIGSINILDGLLKPQEGYAVGFLKPQPNIDSGTVFDAALFHFEFLPGQVLRQRVILLIRTV